MVSRAFVSLIALGTLTLAGILPVLTAGASHPAAVDPSRLVLPASALPPGATVVYSAVSDNADADLTAPPGQYNNDIRGLHQQSYTTLGRLTGYRMRFHFPVAGTEITTQYLASIFATPEAARAALKDAITGFAPHRPDRPAPLSDLRRG